MKNLTVSGGSTVFAIILIFISVVLLGNYFTINELNVEALNHESTVQELEQQIQALSSTLDEKIIIIEDLSDQIEDLESRIGQ